MEWLESHWKLDSEVEQKNGENVLEIINKTLNISLKILDFILKMTDNEANRICNKLEISQNWSN